VLVECFGAGLATFGGCVLALLLRGMCVSLGCCCVGPASRQLSLEVQVAVLSAAHA
jgi:hypothetical protein